MAALPPAQPPPVPPVAAQPPPPPVVINVPIEFTLGDDRVYSAAKKLKMFLENLIKNVRPQLTPNIYNPVNRRIFCVKDDLGSLLHSEISGNLFKLTDEGYMRNLALGIALHLATNRGGKRFQAFHVYITIGMPSPPEMRAKADKILKKLKEYPAAIRTMAELNVDYLRPYDFSIRQGDTQIVAIRDSVEPHRSVSHLKVNVVVDDILKAALAKDLG